MHINRLLTLCTLAAALPNLATAQCSNYANSPGGTLVVQADESIRTVGLPFLFPFNGANYSAITISSNGWIKLGTAASASAELTDSEAVMLNTALTATNFDPRIAVCWDDLNAVSPAGIYYAADATQASVVFRSVIHFGQAAALANCECVLTPTGHIYLSYDATSTYNLSTSTSIVGISKSTGTVLAGTHTVNWTTASPGPIAVTDATAYELFTAAVGLNPFDLHGVGVVLQFAPTGVDTYNVTNTTLTTCTPGVYPPVSSATATLVGTGCPAAVPNGSIYELFTVTTGANPIDLANSSMTFTRSGNDYTLGAGPGFDLNYTTNATTVAGVTDDSQHVFPLTMGTYTFGTISMTQVTVCANGYIWLPTGAVAFNATAANFNSLGTRVAGYWKDLSPQLGGGIWVENSATRFQATWENAPLFTGGGSQTIQVTLDSNGDVSFAYGALTGSVTSNPPLVGITGGASTNLGNSNLATAGVPNAVTRQITGGFSPMSYTVNNAPRIGQNFIMTSTIPNNNIGIGAFVLGSTNLNQTFDSVFGAGTAPGCTFYTDNVYERFFYAPPGFTSFSVTESVPFDISLTGLALQSQAFGFSPLNSAGLIGSNGRSFTTGL